MQVTLVTEAQPVRSAGIQRAFGKTPSQADRHFHIAGLGWTNSTAVHSSATTNSSSSSSAITGKLSTDAQSYSFTSSTNGFLMHVTQTATLGDIWGAPFLEASCAVAQSDSSQAA